MCLKHILFTFSFANIHLVGFYLLVIVGNAVLNQIYKHLFKALLSITVYIEEMELLDPMMLFSIVVAPFYIPTNSAQIPLLLHTLSNTYFLVFVLTTAFLMHVKCYLIGIPFMFCFVLIFR